MPSTSRGRPGRRSWATTTSRTGSESRLRVDGRAKHTCSAPRRTPMLTLVRYRQTWGVVLAKAILDPYWFLVADWFALFLVSRGFKLEDTLMGFWIPFVCADIGNFVGDVLVQAVQDGDD